MKGEFEPATFESQVEHSTTEPKPLLAAKLKNGMHAYALVKSKNENK